MSKLHKKQPRSSWGLEDAKAFLRKLDKEHAQSTMISLSDYLHMQNADPYLSLLLLAQQIHVDLTGRVLFPEDEQIIHICKRILALWEQRYVVDPICYPHTFEATRDAWSAKRGPGDE